LMMIVAITTRRRPRSSEISIGFMTITRQISRERR
jgi:hypothetical protein